MNKPSAVQADLWSDPVLWKCLVLLGLIYLVWSDKLSIVFDLTPSKAGPHLLAEGQKVKASLLPEAYGSLETPRPPAPKIGVRLPPGPTTNVTFTIDPGYAKRNGVASDDVRDAEAKCRAYIDRFAPVAMAEMRKSGIPASVILAQGLLESNSGESQLARKTNNHFGIKCFSRRCKAGHCTNFSDDTHKDFFVKYGNVWASYRAHSKFLKSSKRYAHLFQLDNTDYAGWATGLQKAGYATDKKYGKKLIALIRNLGLDTFDRS